MFNKTTSTKFNIAVSFSGRIWAALLGVVFVPFYIRHLGVESYGIIGIFSSIQAALALFDVGLSQTVNREIARLSASDENNREIRNIARSLEIPYWLISVLVIIVAILISVSIAHYWVTPNRVSVSTVSESLMIMSVGFGFQWCSNFYTGGLTGLQRHLLLNISIIVFATLRSVGALLVLEFVSPTIQTFLIWQTIVGALNTLVLLLIFWKCMPQSQIKPKFEIELIKGMWRYASGMTSIGIVGLILTQLDKVILSKMLDLREFGYYSFALTISTLILFMIIGSIGTVFFPKFSELVETNDQTAINEIYHQASQIMSVLLIPATLVLMLFSSEILFIWTKDQEIVKNSSLLLSVLAFGLGLNGSIQIPYLMQLAHGITKIAFWTNFIAILILIPFLIVCTQYFGAIGGASASVVLGLYNIVIFAQTTHRFILKGELLNWYVKDLFFPLLASTIITTVWKLLIPNNLPRVWIFVILLLAGLTALLGAVLSTYYPRRFFLNTLRNGMVRVFSESLCLKLLK